MATRNYGTAEKRMVLALKPSPMGKLMMLTVLLDAKSKITQEAPVSLQIDNQTPLRTTLLAWGQKKGGVRSIRINVPTESFAPIREAARLSIYSKGEIDESFALSQMKPLLDEMGRCLADLQQYWNVNTEDRSKLKERAKANLAQYFSDADYPALALHKQEGGTVEFALLVDEKGKVADCSVVATSKVPVLDAQACVVLTDRARFTPAVGADGKPTKDAVFGRITWRATRD